MNSDQADIGSATAQRARRYLRWYPAAWRQRYGEEFVAHLESELSERKFSATRTIDIVAHGLVARLSFQRGLRVALRTSLVLALAAIVTVGVIVATRYWAPLRIVSGYDGGVTGIGLFSKPSQVDDVAFNFSTRSTVAIRIIAVTVVPLRGFATPPVVGVEFAGHASELANGRGWPVRLPKSATTIEGNVPLVRALGQSVHLARTDALWLGLRAPVAHDAYAVEGLRVTYERRGVRHTMTISQRSAPNVICGSWSSGPQIPVWCSREITSANTIAAFSMDSTTSTHWPANQALLVAELALNGVGSTQHRAPTLNEVRHWATRLFPSRAVDGIWSVTGVVNGGIAEWRFVISRGPGESAVVRCTNRGRVNGGGTQIGVGVESCPSTSRS